MDFGHGDSWNGGEVKKLGALFPRSAAFDPYIVHGLVEANSQLELLIILTTDVRYAMY